MVQLNRSINFEPDIFKKMEELRGNNAKWRTKFVNDCIREKLNLPAKKGRK